jgi:hypothetical protein
MCIPLHMLIRDNKEQTGDPKSPHKADKTKSKSKIESFWCHTLRREVIQRRTQTSFLLCQNIHHYINLGEKKQRGVCHRHGIQN